MSIEIINSVNPLQLAVHNVHNGHYDHISVPSDRYATYPALYTNKGKDNGYVVCVYIRGTPTNPQKVIAVYEAEIIDGNLCTTERKWERII